MVSRYLQCTFWCFGVFVCVLSRAAAAPITTDTVPISSQTLTNVTSFSSDTTLVTSSFSTSTNSSGAPQNSTGTSTQRVQTSHTTGKSTSFVTPSAPHTISTSNHGTHSTSGLKTSSANHVKSTVSINQASTTGASPKSSFLWKGVSIGLGSLCVLVILAFMMTIAVLCRLRGQLKRMRDTLYPDTFDVEHIYDKLEKTDKQPKNKQNGKVTKSDSRRGQPVKVELKPLQKPGGHDTLDDDEIHSPMSPEPPPIASLSSLNPQKPAPAPPKPPRTDTDKSIQDDEKPTRSVATAYNNEAFDTADDIPPEYDEYCNDVTDASRGTATDKKTDSTGLYDDDENLYEQYNYAPDESRTSDHAKVKHSKSFPVMNEKLSEVQRQNSLSGLPDSVIQRVNSQLGTDGMPLQDIDEDFTPDFDSGIPMATISNGASEPMTFKEFEIDVNSDSKRNDNTDEGDISKEPHSDVPSMDNLGQHQTDNDSISEIAPPIPTATDDTDGPTSGAGLTTSPSAGFDIPLYEDGDFMTQQPIENYGIFDNDDEKDDVPFNQFDEYMEPIKTINPDNKTNPFNHEPKRPEEQVIDPFLNTDIEYEPIEGLPFTNQAQQVEGATSKVADNTGRESIPRLDPLDMFKTEHLRLRTDSSSTPDNYYLDLEEELPELKVEESKRISSQFPADFYIRNMGSAEQLGPAENISANHFDLDFTMNGVNGGNTGNDFNGSSRINNGVDGKPVLNLNMNLTVNAKDEGDTSRKYQNESPIYQNLVFRDDIDVFGNESTT